MLITQINLPFRNVFILVTGLHEAADKALQTPNCYQC